MRVVQLPRSMELAEAQPGDLVSMHDGLGDVLALRMVAVNTTRFLILARNRKPQFSIGLLDADTDCINYGSGWYIDLDNRVPDWPSRSATMAPGTLCAHQNGAVLKAGDDRDYKTRGGFVSLSKFDTSAIGIEPRQGFQSWRLWGSKADAEAAVGRPLFHSLTGVV